MKTLLLATVLSFSSFAWASADTAENVRSLIQQRLELSANKAILFGRTTFGRACEIEIDQKEYQEGNFAHLLVAGKVKDAEEEVVFQFGQALREGTKADRDGAFNLETYKVTEKELSLKVVQRHCLGSIIQTCDDVVNTLQILDLGSKARITVGETIDGIKGLWNSEKLTCFIEKF